jgi:hypothetical protein
MKPSMKNGVLQSIPSGQTDRKTDQKVGMLLEYISWALKIAVFKPRAQKARKDCSRRDSIL